MKTLYVYNGVYYAWEKTPGLPMQEVEFNHFSDVKLYQLEGKVLKKIQNKS